LDKQKGHRVSAMSFIAFIQSGLLIAAGIGVLAGVGMGAGWQAAFALSIDRL